MLVIPRQRGEGVIIDDDIIVTVIEVRDDEVRIGIEISNGGTIRRQDLQETMVGRMEGPEKGRASGAGIGNGPATREAGDAGLRC
jgi:carbon storage regulator